MTRARRKAAPSPEAAKAPPLRQAVPGRVSGSGPTSGALNEPEAVLAPAAAISPGSSVTVFLPGEIRPWEAAPNPRGESAPEPVQNGQNAAEIPSNAEGAEPAEDSGPDSLAAWTARLADVCPGCGLRGLKPGGTCPSCGAAKGAARIW